MVRERGRDRKGRLIKKEVGGLGCEEVLKGKK